MARYRYEALATRADDVPADKVPLCGDALQRGPTGALSVVRVTVVGLDWYGAAATDLRSEAREWFAGAECAELREQAARIGATVLLGIRQRHDPAAEEHAKLRRLHRQTFNPDA